MEDLPHAKAELRRNMRSRRRALPETIHQQAARSLVDQLESIPHWRSATRVALYLATDGEIDLSPVANALRADAKTPYLPVIQADNSLRFAPWTSDEHLRENRFGIPEPSGEQTTAREMDIILLPLVAWDRRGNRLGMGGGFYDRTLAGAGDVSKVGMAYECQRVEALPTESWDVRLDFIITECALYECQGSS